MAIKSWIKPIGTGALSSLILFGANTLESQVQEISADTSRVQNEIGAANIPGMEKYNNIINWKYDRVLKLGENLSINFNDYFSCLNGDLDFEVKDGTKSLREELKIMEQDPNLSEADREHKKDLEVMLKSAEANPLDDKILITINNAVKDGNLDYIQEKLQGIPSRPYLIIAKSKRKIGFDSDKNRPMLYLPREGSVLFNISNPGRDDYIKLREGIMGSNLTQEKLDLIEQMDAQAKDAGYITELPKIPTLEQPEKPVTYQLIFVPEQAVLDTVKTLETITATDSIPSFEPLTIPADSSDLIGFLPTLYTKSDHPDYAKTLTEVRKRINEHGRNQRQASKQEQSLEDSTQTRLLDSTSAESDTTKGPGVFNKLYNFFKPQESSVDRGVVFDINASSFGIGAKAGNYGAMINYGTSSDKNLVDVTTPVNQRTGRHFEISKDEKELSLLGISAERYFENYFLGAGMNIWKYDEVNKENIMKDGKAIKPHEYKLEKTEGALNLYGGMTKDLGKNWSVGALGGWDKRQGAYAKTRMIINLNQKKR